MFKSIKLLMGALLTALIFVSTLHAAPRRGNAEKVIPLTTNEAAQQWQKFISSKIAGDYCLTFSIAHNPRKSETVMYKGVIFGTERDGKTLTRILVCSAENPEAPVADFILSNSPTSSKIWRANKDKYELIPENKWHEPMLEGLIFSPFDILMPYKYWEARYDRPAREGKAVHIYALNAPKGVSTKISKIEIALTREFDSPTRTEMYDENGESAKTVSLGSVKKVDDLWIILELSARDNALRDTDKLRFIAGALRTKLPQSVFSPDLAPSLPQMPKIEKL